MTSEESRASEPPRSLPPTPATFGRFVAGVIIVALAAASFAIAFRWTLAAITHYYAGAQDVVAFMRALPIWLRFTLPAFGGLCAGLLVYLSQRFGTTQGVSDVMEAVVLGKVRLSLRVTLLKSLGSWFAIASGGSLGREGPLIQFGGAFGQFVSARLQLSATHSRRLIAAGAAAGFAAAYNTPFAAVLFVLEVVTGVVVLDAILPALIAVCISTALMRASVGEGAIYGQRVFHLEAPLELLAFAGLGIASALSAQAFMRLLSFGETLFRRSRLGLPWRPALGGLIAGGCAAYLPDVAGNGYEPLNLLLDGEFTVGFVVLLALGKAFATTASVSSGSPGGVFTPTLLIGGATGFVYAWAFSHVAQLGPAGGYALVGMAAATAASTHAPLMAAVLVFELSGDYAIALPLVLATAIATLVSRRMRRESLYSAELKQRGIAWELTMDGRRVTKT
ncbi:MAG TPA: chloride channel protein [Polyangiales bacterium]|nr:chloride channel protein [Polyangiales bacterium]